MPPRRFHIRVVVLSFSILAARASIAGGEEIRWSVKTPMPVPRGFASAVAFQGKIYVIGGYSGSNLSRVDVYDPGAGSWSTRQPMPTPRTRPITAVVGGRIYAIGGVQITSPYQGGWVLANEAYDPATDSWSARADFPLSTSTGFNLGDAFFDGAAVAGKIYVTLSRLGTSATWAYDPASDSWDTARSPVPFTYTSFAAAALNGKVYVAARGETPWGGPFSNGASFGEYDPAADLWIIRPSSLSARRAFGLAALGGIVYAVGGAEIDHGEPERTFFRAVGTVEAFDPAANRWFPRAPLAVPRLAPAVAAVDGKLYVLGGARRDSNETLTPLLPLADVEEGVVVTTGCQPSPASLCLDQQPGDSRFEITVAYSTTQGGGRSGDARAIALSPLGINRGGVFWFFSADNPEMLVKVLDGCASNGYYWVFSSAGTNVGFTLRVRDAKTGRQFTRTNPDLSAALPVQDTLALPCRD